MRVTFGNNFDFERTYSEYGFVTTPLEECIDRFENLFSGITAIHFLHNCEDHEFRDGHRLSYRG